MEFHPHQNYLSAKVEVEFDKGGVVDMIGRANTGTSYSLPGHVILTLPTLPSTLHGEMRDMLLRIEIEGKSEFWDDQGRYTAMRLYSFQHPIASPHNSMPIPSHDPSRPNASFFQAVVQFDIRLPGWLPPSHDSGMTTVGYGVRVDAIIGWIGQKNVSKRVEPYNGLFSTAVAPSGSAKTSSFDRQLAKARPKSAFGSFSINKSLQPGEIDFSSSKSTPFTVHRHRLPSAISGPASDLCAREFSLTANSEEWNPLDCVVIVPGWVDLHGPEPRLQVKLRIQAKRGLSLAQSPLQNETATSVNGSAGSADVHMLDGFGSVPASCQRQLEPAAMERQSTHAGEESFIYLKELGVVVEEVEESRSYSFTSYTAAFPIPTEQPSRNSAEHQLLDPNSGRIVGSDQPQAIIITTPIRFGTSPTTVPLCGPKEVALPAYIQLYHENGERRLCDPPPLYMPSLARRRRTTPHPNPPLGSRPRSFAPSYNSLFPENEASRSSSSSVSSDTHHEDAYVNETASELSRSADSTGGGLALPTFSNSTLIESMDIDSEFSEFDESISDTPLDSDSSREATPAQDDEMDIDPPATCEAQGLTSSLLNDSESALRARKTIPVPVSSSASA
ncbi:hypothetical protein IAR55_002477 [Kwoniella newhampshirensis]|uniref:Arrestin-like N-terminal domain-containing protein n=1 Tax=Kwoniella newhampshirensis TaxID=1651941 RepID=A0AAW0YSR1_9TREE